MPKNNTTAPEPKAVATTAETARPPMEQLALFTLIMPTVPGANTAAVLDMQGTR